SAQPMPNPLTTGINWGMQAMNAPLEHVQYGGADALIRQRLYGEDPGLVDRAMGLWVTGTSGLGDFVSDLTDPTDSGLPGAIPDSQNFAEWIDSLDEDTLRALYEGGYDSDNDGIADFTGAEAVWNAYVRNWEAGGKILTDTLQDPLLFVGPGGRTATRAAGLPLR